MESGTKLVEKFWELFSKQEWDLAGALLDQGFVATWPQSNERIVGIENFLSVNRFYPGNHKIEVVRSFEVGNNVLTTVWIEADTGQTTFANSIFEINSGKITKVEEYWAEPYPAPEWRSKWVDPYQWKVGQHKTLVTDHPTKLLPSLETERLILRPLQESDAEAIFDYAKNPNVSRYTLWEPHLTSEDSLEFIKEYAFSYYKNGVPEPFGICLKSDPSKVIGTVGCFWTSKTAKAMELAYALDEKFWGQGLVVEGSKAVMDFCFKEFQLKRIQARCKTENLASRRVMEKLGMKHEGTLQAAISHRDKYWDMHYFGVVTPDHSPVAK